LREGLRGKETEEMALKLMSATDSEAQADATGSDAELRGLIDLMLNDWLMPQETAALLASKTDPLMRQRYYDINARRRQLLTASQGAELSNSA
jgi:DNA primase